MDFNDLGDYAVLEREVEGFKVHRHAHKSELEYTPPHVWRHFLTEEEINKLSTQQLVDIALTSSSIKGMFTFDKDLRGEQRLREAELFLLRKELIERLELLERLLKQRNNAWKVLNDN